MSLVALGIGLVVGNILDPGSSLAVTDAVKEVGQAQVDAEAKDTTEFLLGVIPTWGHSRDWGYGPSGIVGLILIILLILLLLGKI